MGGGEEARRPNRMEGDMKGYGKTMPMGKKKLGGKKKGK